jgi:hypothetical protein
LVTGFTYTLPQPGQLIVFADASSLFFNKDDFQGVDGFEKYFLCTLRIFFGVFFHYFSSSVTLFSFLSLQYILVN